MPIYDLKHTETGAIVSSQNFNSAPPFIASQKKLTWVLREIVPHVPTPDEIKAQISAAIESMLNKKANDYRYKDYHAAMTYVGSPVAKFNTEGVAFRNWVSLVWAHVDQVEQDVTNQLRPIPTAEELIAELPQFTITYP